MTTFGSVSAPTSRSAVSLGTALSTGAVAGGIAAVTNFVISAIARGPLGASDGFIPLTPGPVVMWTILGAITGAVGWRLIVNTSAHSRGFAQQARPDRPGPLAHPGPRAARHRLGGRADHRGRGGPVVMHVVTAVIAVTAYRKAMPAS
jgi:hypothetical protein